jgi:cysteine-rich repeat protein
MRNRTLFMTLALVTVGALVMVGCSDDDSGTPVCGNGVVEDGESCDDVELDGQTCTTMAGNFTGGTLACSNTCTFDTLGCTGGDPQCGNDVQETGEECDGVDLADSDCTDAGNYVSGTLGCAGDCTFDVSQCEVDPNCGNGDIDSDEVCDSTNLDGQSCTSITGSYTGGTLACNVDCTWNESLCTTGTADAVQQIIDARAATDGTGLTLPIEGAWVTYVKTAVGPYSAGFFLQASVAGPALYVAVDPATLTPVPAVGDEVTLTVTTMATVGLMRQAVEITGFSVTSNSNDVTTLAQEVSSATGLVTDLDSYEVELISVTGTIADEFGYAGVGHQKARFETAGITTTTLLTLRVPDAILPTTGLAQGCEVQIQYTPLWRYDTEAQISVWATQDASIISCPAPEVLSATATGDSTVVITINRAVDPASVLANGSQFTFNAGLTASAATATGNLITVTTSAQTPAANYTVTVAQTVTDIFGVGMAGQPDNQADFTGYVVNLCGNGTVDTGEECDDSNRDSYDGCSNTCQDDAPHLLISELVVTPTEGEFVELYNPTSAAIALDDIYLSDFNTYYTVAQSTAAPGNNDFLVQFPAGSSIPAGGFVVVSIRTATNFSDTYGVLPDFDLDAADTSAPAMVGTIGTDAGLSNGSEMLVLFSWDGSSDLIQDLDYVLWGNNTNPAMDKSGITAGSSTYLADTAPASQLSTSSPGTGTSLERCDTSEGAETDTGGNGLTGNDETSEDLSATFVVGTPTPGAPPAAGTCAP